MEEGTEFLNRLEKGGPFPMFTSWYLTNPYQR